MSKKFKYHGVLGGAAKMKKMLAEYRMEGFDEYILSKINTPVGISIKSQTPEEIAVSIAAAIIQVKNENL
ncbi:MAG: XdhC family protein [Ginsengibacter sp.]